MDPTTPEGRERLRAMLAAGTPGPWSKPFPDGALTANGIDSLLGLDADGMAIVHRPEDAALIAAAVNALPALLDALDAAERVHATIRELYVPRDAVVVARERAEAAEEERDEARRERDALRAWVREALPSFESMAEPVEGYGYPISQNPHEFTPDPDGLRPEELAAWEAAKVAWDAGARTTRPETHEYTTDADGKVNGWVTRAPWGLGTYTYTDEDAVRMRAEGRALLGEEE